MGYEVIGTMVPDNLIAGGDVPVLLKGVMIAKGNILKRGSVLGVVTASGKAVLADKSANDGSRLQSTYLPMMWMPDTPMWWPSAMFPGFSIARP